MPTRRHFLGASAALLSGAAFAPAAALRSLARQEPRGDGLSVLVLGGTGFIGPHLVEALLAGGHRVATFTRGSKPGSFGERVEELVGDRDAGVGDGLAALEGERRWDVVIDNSGYVPRHVRDSAELLAGRCGRYVFTSTVAVYDFEALEPDADGLRLAHREAPLHAAPEPATERVTGATYGPLKAEADRIVREVYGDAATVVRPCYIVGPGDSTDRFTYWVERAIRGGDVVCMARPEWQVNWIDVRDLAAFMVHLIEQDTPGVFNAVGPASPVSNEMLMHGLRAACAGPVELHWPSAELLDELEYPTPMFDRSRWNYRTDAAPAVAAGLTYRSLAETTRDVHAWWLEQDEERRGRAVRRWPTAEAEAAVLARMGG